MALYVRLQDNVVVDGPRVLPKRFGGIPNFDVLSDSELLKYGWYKVTSNDIFDTTVDANSTLNQEKAKIHGRMAGHFKVNKYLTTALSNRMSYAADNVIYAIVGILTNTPMYLKTAGGGIVETSVQDLNTYINEFAQDNITSGIEHKNLQSTIDSFDGSVAALRQLLAEKMKNAV